MIRFLTSTFLIVLFVSCAAVIPKLEKINGVSLVAAREAVVQQHIDPIVNINANYAAVMPYGFIRNLETPEIIYNTQRQWFGETSSGAKQYIALLHKNNIKVMLKPHLWISHGEFTGHLKLDTEEDWKALEDSYEGYILEFAKLAQESKVAMYCIGTELNSFVSARPQFWKRLIKKVREVYKGQLTYAENWDTFANVPFWKELDFIGVDAYFPLSKEETPSLDSLKLGWQLHKTNIIALHKKVRRPVLFTEYGYRSTNFTAREPWNSSRDMSAVNLEAQSIAFQALFDEFWREDWFAGGFLWKWFHSHEKVGGKENTQFTIQNKPAEDLVRSRYAKD